MPNTRAPCRLATCNEVAHSVARLHVLKSDIVHEWFDELGWPMFLSSNLEARDLALAAVYPPMRISRYAWSKVGRLVSNPGRV